MTKNIFEWNFRTEFGGFSSHHHAVMKLKIRIAYLRNAFTYKLKVFFYPLPSTIRNLDHRYRYENITDIELVTITIFWYNLFNCLILEQNLSLQTFENNTLKMKKNRFWPNRDTKSFSKWR